MRFPSKPATKAQRAYVEAMVGASLPANATRAGADAVIRKAKSEGRSAGKRYKVKGVAKLGKSKLSGAAFSAKMKAAKAAKRGKVKKGKKAYRRKK